MAAARLMAAEFSFSPWFIDAPRPEHGADPGRMAERRLDGCGCPPEARTTAAISITFLIRVLSIVFN